jgi:nucleotide-binding universal stress UspA family protein
VARHATGAGGDNIGPSTAKGVGFRYVDEEIIQLAAERHGIDADLVADAERRQSLLNRILNDIAPRQ